MTAGINSRNIQLLTLLQIILRLKPSQIARAGNVSATYITRLLKLEIQGSVKFWSTLNANLLRESLSSSIFQLSNNLPENAAELIEELTIAEPHQIRKSKVA